MEAGKTTLFVSVVLRNNCYEYHSHVYLPLSVHAGEILDIYSFMDRIYYVFIHLFHTLMCIDITYYECIDLFYALIVFYCLLIVFPESDTYTHFRYIKQQKLTFMDFRSAHSIRQF